MRRPIAKKADVTHEIAHRSVLMLHHEVAHAVVEMK
jgi:hypothetical protein